MESFIRSSDTAAIFTKQHLLKGLLMVITGVMLSACSPDQQATDHGHSHGSGADHHAHEGDSHDHGEDTHTHDDAPTTEAFYGDEAAATETSPAATSASAPDAHSSEAHDHSHADDEHTHDHDH